MHCYVSEFPRKGDRKISNCYVANFVLPIFSLQSLVYKGDWLSGNN